MADNLTVVNKGVMDEATFASLKAANNPVPQSEQAPVAPAATIDPNLLTQLGASPTPVKVTGPLTVVGKGVIPPSQKKVSNDPLAAVKIAADNIDSAIDDNAELPNDAKTYLKLNKFNMTHDQLLHSIDVFSGKTPEQATNTWYKRLGLGFTSGATTGALLGAEIGGALTAPVGGEGALPGAGVGAVVGGIAEGVGQAVFGSNKNYYLDNNGIPQPLKFGEKAPPGTLVEDTFSDAISPAKSNALLNAGGHFINEIMKTGDILPNLAKTLEEGATGKEGMMSKWADATNQQLADMRINTDEKPLVHLSKVSDILKSTSWNPEALTGLVGDLAGMIVTFGGLGKGIAAAGGKAIASTAGVSVAMLGSGLEAADQAKLDPRQKAAVATIMGIGNAMLFHLGGTYTANLLGQVASKEGFADVERIVVGHVAEETAEKTLSKEEMQNLVANGLQKYISAVAEKADSWASSYPASAALNIGQMEAIDLYNHGVKQISNAINGYSQEDEKGFKDSFTNPEATSSYIENAVSGLLFGALGNTPATDVNRGKVIFDRLIRDKEPELKQALQTMVEGGRLTKDGYDQALNMVKKYKQYKDQIATDKLNDAQQQEIMQNAYQMDLAKSQLFYNKNVSIATIKGIEGPPIRVVKDSHHPDVYHNFDVPGQKFKIAQLDIQPKESGIAEIRDEELQKKISESKKRIAELLTGVPAEETTIQQDKEVEKQKLKLKSTGDKKSGVNIKGKAKGPEEAEPVGQVFTHPESEMSEQGLANTNDDANLGKPIDKLTPKGIEGAKKMDLTAFTSVETSTNLRAKETASHAKTTFGTPIKENPLFNTLDMPEGMPENPEQEKLALASDKGKEFMERMEKAWQYKKAHPETAFVTHSKVDRALQALDLTDGNWTDETTADFLGEPKEQAAKASPEVLKEQLMQAKNKAVDEYEQNKSAVINYPKPGSKEEKKFIEERIKKNPDFAKNEKTNANAEVKDAKSSVTMQQKKILTHLTDANILTPEEARVTNKRDAQKAIRTGILREEYHKSVLENEGKKDTPEYKKIKAIADYQEHSKALREIEKAEIAPKTEKKIVASVKTNDSDKAFIRKGVQYGFTREDIDNMSDTEKEQLRTAKTSKDVVDLHDKYHPKISENYKGVTIREGEIKNAAGKRGGAQYNRTTGEITIDRDILKEKYKEKAWTKPAIDGVEALPEGMFPTYQDWENFAIEHEYQHSKFPQNEGEGKAEYENRINKEALKALDKESIEDRIDRLKEQLKLDPSNQDLKDQLLFEQGAKEVRDDEINFEAGLEGLNDTQKRLIRSAEKFKSKNRTVDPNKPVVSRAGFIGTDDKIIDIGLTLYQKAIRTKISGKILTVSEAVSKALKELIQRFKDTTWWKSKSYEEKQQFKSDFENYPAFENELNKARSLIDNLLDDEFIKASADYYGISTDDFREYLAQYGDKNDRLQHDYDSIRTAFVDKNTNLPFVKDVSEAEIKDAIFKHVKNFKWNPNDIRAGFDELPIPSLVNYWKDNRDKVSFRAFERMYMHFNSIRKLAAFHLINTKGRIYDLNISNPKESEAEKGKRFQRSTEAFIAENNIDTAKFSKLKDSWWAEKQKLQKEIHPLMRVAREMEIRQLSLQRQGKTKEAAEVKAKIEKYKEDHDLIRKINDLISADANFLQKITGIQAGYWMQLANTMNKNGTMPSDEAFYKNAISYPETTKSPLEFNIINKKDNVATSVEKLKQNLDEETGTKKYDKEGKEIMRSQWTSLAKADNELAVHDDYAESYDGVDGDKQTSFEGESALTFLADATADKDIRESDIYKNNHVVQANPTGIRIAKLEGMKDNIAGGKANGLKDFNSLDAAVTQLVSFIRTGHSAKAGTGRYFQFFDQQSDSKTKYLMSMVRHSMADLKEQINFLHKNAFDVEGNAKAGKAKADQEIAYVHDLLTSQKKNIFGDQHMPDADLKKLAEEFVYNYAYNKYFADEYFRTPDIHNPKNPLYNDYRLMIKRKIAGAGDGLILGKDGGIGDTYNAAVMEDPSVLAEIPGVFSLKLGKATDGQILLMPWHNEAIANSSGQKYKGIVKDFHYQHLDGKEVMMKGNAVVLPESLADKNPVVRQILDWAKNNNVDRIIMKSSAKLWSGDVVKPEYEYSEDGKSVTGIKLPESHTPTPLDSKYLRIQQDLTNKAELREGKLTTQIVNVIKQLANRKDVEALFARATELADQEIRKEFFSLDEQGQKAWFADNLADTPENLMALQALNDKKGSLDDPSLAVYLNKIFGSVVEKRLLNLKVNKGLAIHAKIPGMNHDMPTIDGKKIIHGQASLPSNMMRSAENPNGLEKNETGMVIRVPTSNFHSTAFFRVKDFLPEDMRNAFIGDMAYQHSSGHDNDGDAAHIWTKARDKEGNVIKYQEGKSESYQALMNEVYDKLEEHYSNADNIKLLTDPINTEQVDPYIKNYMTSTENPNLFSSWQKLFDSNRQSRVVVGALANGQKVAYNLQAVNAVIKSRLGHILFPKFNEDGSYAGTHELKFFKPSDFQHINLNMSNNINQALDDPKLGKLYAMGITSATVNIANLISAMGSDTLGSMIHFLNHPVVREFEKVFNDSKSVVGSDKTNIFSKTAKALAEKYKSSLYTEEGNNVFDDEKAYEKSLPPSEIALTKRSLANDLHVLGYLQYLDYAAKDIFKLNKLIGLNDKAIRSYGEFMEADQLIKDLTDKKGNALNVIDIKDLMQSDTVKRTILNVKIAKDKYDLSIAASPAMREVAKSIEKEYQLINGKAKLTVEQHDNLFRALHEFALTQGMNITRSKEELRTAAKGVFNQLEDSNPLRTLFEVKDGKLQLSPDFTRKRLDMTEMKKYQSAFSKLDTQDRRDLMEYQIKEFGWTKSTKIGGFLPYINLSSRLEVADAIRNVIPALNAAGPEAIKEIQKQIQRNNPFTLIPEAQPYYEFGQRKIKGFVKGEKGMGMLRGEYPSRVRMPLSEEDRSSHVFEKTQDASGQQYGADSDAEPVAKLKGEGYSPIKEVAGHFEESKKSQEPGDKKVNYQATSQRPYLKNNPEFRDYVYKKINEHFPNVEIFKDPLAWQDFLDRNFPGTQMDFTKLGAAIGKAFFINEGEARQDTAMHEMAELYWDMLPENDSVKLKLMNAFGDRESAIMSIGKVATDEAMTEYEPGLKSKFTALLQSFWRKVKNTIWGNWGGEKYSQVMAERMFKDSSAADTNGMGNTILNYYGGTDSNAYMNADKIQERFEDIKKILKDRGLPEIDKITDNIIRKLDRNDVKLEQLDNFFEKTWKELINKTDPRDAVGNVIDITPKRTWIKNKFTYDYEHYKEEAANETDPDGIHHSNLQMIEEKYEEYQQKLKTLSSIVRKYNGTDTHTSLEVLGLNGSETILREIRDLMYIDHPFAEHVVKMLNEQYVYKLMANAIREEAKPTHTDPPAFMLALHSILTEKNSPDWKQSLSKFLGPGAFENRWSTKERMLQSRQHLMGDIHQRAIDDAAQVRKALKDIKKELKDAGGSVEDLIRKTKDGGEIFLNPHTLQTKAEYKKIVEDPAKAGDPKAIAYKKFIDTWFKMQKKYMSRAFDTDDQPGFTKQAFWMVPQAEMDEWEMGRMKPDGTFSRLPNRYGISQVALSKVSKEHRYDNIAVNYKDGSSVYMTLGDAKRDIRAKYDRGMWKGASLAKQISDLTAEAEKAFNDGRPTDRSGAIIDRGPNFKLGRSKDEMRGATKEVNARVSTMKDKFSTSNRQAVEDRYIQNVIEAYHKNLYQPMFNFMENYYGKNNKTVLQQWVKDMNSAELYGENPESMLGPVGGKWLTWLNNYTAWKFLAVNFHAAQFNLAAGFTQNFRHIGIKAMATGWTRMTSGFRPNMKFSEGFVSADFIDLLHTYQIVDISHAAEMSIGSMRWEQIKQIMFSSVTYPEYMIHGTTICGLLTNKEWNSFKEWSKGGKVGEPPISKGRILHLIAEDAMVSGSYHTLSRRRVNLTPEGRTVMALRNWLPDIIEAHFMSERTDMFFNQKKGIYVSVRDVFKQVFLGKEGTIAERWNNLSDIDKQNMNKCGRELFVIAGFAMIRAAMNEDKKAQANIARIIGDIGWVYDLENYKFMLNSPVSAFKTVSDGIDFLEASFGMVTGNEAWKMHRKGPYGNIGDSKAPVVMAKALPASNIVKNLLKEDSNQ